MPIFFCIGFPIQSDEEVVHFANVVAEDATPLEVEGGTYLRWTCESGAELWLLVGAEHDLLAVAPHYSGESEFPVRIEGMVDKPGASELDGAFFAWANPVEETEGVGYTYSENGADETDEEDSEETDEEEGQPAPGDYPFVFDSPDFRAYDDLKLPSLAVIQLAAFAYQAAVYESIEAYELAQAAESEQQSNGEQAPTFAAQSFVPVGLFPSEGEEETIPEPVAMFTGTILKTELKENELTGLAYHYALVETFGGQIDVVIDPEVVNVAPVVGGIIHGTFLLSGRLLDYESEE